jgi:hypothetical protein
MALPCTRISQPNPDHTDVRALYSRVRTNADNNTSAAGVKYRHIEPSLNAPWHASVRSHVGALVGTDDLGDLVLDLFTGSSPLPLMITTAPESDVSLLLRRRGHYPATSYREEQQKDVA